MAITIQKTQLPVAKGGRKPTPLNEELSSALIDALKSEPLDDGRPAGYGPETEYETEGKAGGPARRYAEAASKTLKKKVRVNVYGIGAADKDGKASGPYRWRIYIPLSEQKK